MSSFLTLTNENKLCWQSIHENYFAKSETVKIRTDKKDIGLTRLRKKKNECATKDKRDELWETVKGANISIICVSKKQQE